MQLSKSKVQRAMLKAEIPTQGELATKANLNPNTITSLLRGANPKMNTLVKLAAALDVEPEALLMEETP